MLDEVHEQLTSKYLEYFAGVWAKTTEPSIQLEKIYVMLQAIENRPSNLRGKRFNSTNKEYSLSEPNETGEPSEPPPSPLLLSKILVDSRHLVLLGEPGTGKSTTLQFIGLCFASAGWAKTWFNINEPYVPVLLLLREYAEMFSNAEMRLEKILAQAVNNFLELPDGEAESLVAKWRDDNRLLILLDGLDEVPNPADDNLRTSVAKKIGLYAGSENGRKCRIVLSSRQAGYQAGHIAYDNDFRTFVLKSFQHLEDTIPYLEKWLLAVPTDGDRQRPANEPRMILAEINKQPALRRYINNPLLLRLAVETYADFGTLASNRGKMYEEYVSKTIWKALGSSSLTTDAQRRNTLEALETLAWQLQSQGKIDDPKNLEFLREKLRLVEELEDGKLKFSHETFQGYFVARRLAKAWREKKNRRHAWVVMHPRLHDPTWHEPLLLLIGMLDKGDALSLVREVLKAHSRYEQEIFRDLSLAAELLGERSDVNGKLKPVRDVINLLKKRLLKFSFPSYKVGDVRRKASKALETIGEPVIPATIPLLKRYYLSDYLDFPSKDRSPDPLPSELRLRTGLTAFIRRVGNRTSETLIRFWDEIQSYERDVQEEYSRVLINIGKPTLPILTEAMRNSRSSVRLRAFLIAIEIYTNNGSHESILALIGLTKNQDRMVRQTAIYALASLGEKDALPLLVQLVLEEGLSSLWRFETFGVSAIPVLEQIYELKKDWGNEIAAVLYRIDDEGIIPFLLKIYMDEYWWYREEPRTALRKFGVRATPYLFHALRESTEGGTEKRLAIISEIGATGDPRAIPYLSRLLRHEKDNKTRSCIIDSLGNIDSERVIDPLFKAIVTTPLDKSIWVSIGRLRPYANALAKLGPSIIPKLTDKLEYLTKRVLLIYDHWDRWGDQQRMFDVVVRYTSLRFCLVETLRRLGDQSTVPILLRMLGKVAWEIESLRFCTNDDFLLMIALRQRAKRLNQVVSITLGEELSGQYDDISFQVDGVAARRFILDFEYDDLYREIVNALGDSLDKRCVPALCVEIGDEFNYEVVLALGKIGDSTAVSHLSALLKKTKAVSERSHIAIALAKCGDADAIPVLRECLPLFDDYQRDAQLEAILLIGKFGTPEAILALKEFSSAPENKNKDSRWIAVACLAKLEDQEARDLLISGDEIYRHNVETTLKQLGDVTTLLQFTGDIGTHVARAILEEMGVAALPSLVQALGDPKPNVRLTATGILERLGLPALDGLILALSDSEASVREQAARALCKLNDQRATSTLVIGLGDTEPDVRYMCAIALGKLGDQRALAVLVNERQTSQYYYPEEEDILVKLLGDFGDVGSIPLLMELLPWQSATGTALEKIVARVEKKNSSSLRYPIRIARLVQDQATLEILIARQDILQTPRLTNPLEPIELSPMHLRYKIVGLIVGETFLAGVGAVIASDVFQGTVTKALPASWQAWALADPAGTAIIRIGIFGAIVWLIKWVSDTLSNQLKKAKVAENTVAD